MQEKTRLMTNVELQQRYGEEGEGFSIFTNDLGGRMVRVRYLKDSLTNIDLIFSTRLPVDENDVIIDPTTPVFRSRGYEQNGYQIKFSKLIGSYWSNTNELYITDIDQKAVLQVYEIQRTNGREISINLTKKITVSHGKIEFAVTKRSKDGKSVTIYVMATATEDLKDLKIGLEV